MITFYKLGAFGRLGNQMFQYAAAKSAALNKNTSFAIPVENQVLSHYFNLECDFYFLQQEYEMLSELNSYNETCFEFDNRFLNIQDNTSLEGYFQSERYFEKYKEQIRKDFQFKEEIYERSKKLIDQFKADGSVIVSLHVRRGDYLDLQNFHPVCDLEYYKKSLDLFTAKNIKILIFSDDIEWCKQNINRENCFYSPFKNQAEDLCAMSLCDHNIIANSSFSWWGAWLNNKQNRIVVAPRKWFGPAYQDKDTTDLYCKDWLIL